MNSQIYAWTGVRRPQVSPGALQVLASSFEDVRGAAVAGEREMRSTIADVLLKNQGEASSAFEKKISGAGSSVDTLAQLSGAALATRNAHTAAALEVARVQLTLDAVANRAAADLVQGRALPIIQQVIHHMRVLTSAKAHMEALSAIALDNVRTIYNGVSLPVITELTYEQGRGTILPELEDAWSDMDTDERLEFLDAVYDDVTKDLPPEDRPTIIYYSHQDPLPEGAVRPPEDTAPETNGWYDPNTGDIMLNLDKIDVNSSTEDPSAGIVHTIVHELAHAEQHRLRKQYEVMIAVPDLIQDIRDGRRPDPFVEEGSTLDEVERIRNQTRAEDDPYWKYKYRPGEMGARRSGIEYLDDLTVEKLNELTP